MSRALARAAAGAAAAVSLPRVSLDEQRRARQAAEKRSPLLPGARTSRTRCCGAPTRSCTACWAIGGQPQLYLLRWLRLLFGREFHLADSMVVDAPSPTARA